MDKFRIVNHPKICLSIFKFVCRLIKRITPKNITLAVICRENPVVMGTAKSGQIFQNTVIMAW